MNNNELETDFPLGMDRYSKELLLVVGDYTKKIAGEAYRNGYLDGYRKGQGDKRAHTEPPSQEALFLSVSIERLKLPTYTKNALIRNGCTNIRDIISAKEKDIRRMPKVGPKCIRTVARLLQDIGFPHTDWEICAD